MILATCTLDGVTYHSPQFAAMGEERIEALRYKLICSECEGRAYYKRAGRDGRAACFGARHNEGCDQATAGGAGWGDGGEGEQPEIENDGAPIRIDLNVGRRPSEEVAGAAADQRGRNRGRRFRGQDGQRRNHPTQRLRSILRALLLTDFGDSNQMVQPPNGRAMTARHYFVPAEFAGAVRHREEPRGLWGTVLSVRHVNDVYWINTGDRTALSFLVTEAVMAEVLLRFHVTDFEDLVGADILVLDRPRFSQSGKLFAKISGVDYVTLRLPAP